MKKIIFLYFLIIIFSYSNAQTYIGVKGGAHISTIKFLPSLPVVNRSFPNAGLIFIYSNLPYRGIQVEINFIQKGFDIDYKNGFGIDKKYNFIEIPLLSRFYIRDQGTRIVITIGPNIGYHFDESGNGYKTDWYYGQIHFKPENMHDYTIYKVEYGIIGGLGLFREFKNTSLQAEFRTYYGLSQFVKNEAFIDNRTMIYSLSLSYLFNL